MVTQLLAEMPLAQRTQLAMRLRNLRASAAMFVTEEFFRVHPDWLERYGEQGRMRGLEDAAYHMDFLAGAIESGSVTSFQEYCLWTARVLKSRKIACEFLSENLRQLASYLANHMEPADARIARGTIEAGCDLKEVDLQATRDSQDSQLVNSQKIYLQSILKGHRKAAVRVVSECLLAGHSIADIYVANFSAVPV